MLRSPASRNHYVSSKVIDGVNVKVTSTERLKKYLMLARGLRFDAHEARLAMEVKSEPVAARDTGLPEHL
jgi:hypothetical protein